jgi:hypothetical protein
VGEPPHAIAGFSHGAPRRPFYLPVGCIILRFSGSFIEMQEE